ncbi:unnamed protein product, partial [Didymodactylos carnosus]
MRNYVRKRVQSYSDDDINLALQLIREGKTDVKKASEKYKIPASTLYSRLSGANNSGPVGGKTILNKAEETHLVYVIKKLQEYNHPVSNSDVRKLAAWYMLELNKNVSNNGPGKDWFYGFMARWSHELKVMKSIKLEKARNEALPKLNLFDKPSNIFNCDESGFSDDPDKKCVVVKRETIAVHGGSGKKHTTVLLTTSASGRCFPPYIVYKAERLYSTWMPKKNYPGTMYNTSQSGWMEEHIFYDWFSKQFLKETKNLKRPLLLIMDNHYSHLSYRTMKLALDNEVHILSLPPHTTSQLQPLDVYTFKVVKTEWRKILRDYYLTTNADNVDKSVFPLLLKKLYTNALRPAYCSGGFAKAGIYPYDKRAIPKEKISYSATSSSNSGQPCLTRALSNEYLLPVHDHMTNNNRILNNNESGYYRLRRSPSAPLLSSTLNEIAASTAILNDTVTTPMSTTSISSSVLSMNKSLTFQTDNLVSIASPITSVPKPPILSSSSIVGKSFSLLNSSQVQN